jgi:hypothetical protein
MQPRYPQRPHIHVLETISERFFEGCLPPSWTTRTTENDYGIDRYVDICAEQEASPLEFLVQLKSSEAESRGDTEIIQLKVSTYNYLWDKLQVVLLAKYCEEANEAYWLLLKDVPEPSQDNETFTIRIPKTNTLSTIDWNEIKKYVNYVSKGKLEAWRHRER